MRDAKNAKEGCAALSVAIAEVAEAAATLAVMTPAGGLRGYPALAAKLGAIGRDVEMLAAAMAILARRPQR